MKISNQRKGRFFLMSDSYLPFRRATLGVRIPDDRPYPHYCIATQHKVFSYPAYTAVDHSLSVLYHPDGPNAPAPILQIIAPLRRRRR